MTFRNRTPNTKKSILLLQHIAAYNVNVHHFVFSKCDVYVITWHGLWFCIFVMNFVQIRQWFDCQLVNYCQKQYLPFIQNLYERQILFLAIIVLQMFLPIVNRKLGCFLFTMGLGWLFVRFPIIKQFSVENFQIAIRLGPTNGDSEVKIQHE